MRLSFSNDTPLDVQITRSLKRKQKGRKHEHKASSRKTSLPKKKNRARRSDSLKRKIYKYWSGEIDEYPI